jgi:hypothetical protein
MKLLHVIIVLIDSDGLDKTDLQDKVSEEQRKA